MACRYESLIIGHVTKALKLFVIVTIMTTIIVPLNCNETIISQITFCSNYGCYSKVIWPRFGLNCLPIRFGSGVSPGTSRLARQCYRSLLTECIADTASVFEILLENISVVAQTLLSDIIYTI